MSLARSAPALLVGAVGAAAAMAVGVPLAPLIGAVFAVMIAMAAPVRFTAHVDPLLRRTAHVALGIVLGARFPEDLLERLVLWPVTIAAIPVFVLVALGAGYAYLRMVAAYDRPTALLTAMPGGLLIMVALSESHGGRRDVILMSHTVRIILAVTLIPFALLEFGTDTTGPLAGSAGPVELAMMTAGGIAGSILFRWIKFPAADVMGPMCASAVLHLTGLTPGMPPGAILAAALCVSGAALGSQTKGVTLRSLGPVLGHTAAMFALFTAIAVFTAFSLSALTGLEAEAVFLAFAPGGLTEMAAVSLAMSHDPAFVALHHALRVTVCAFIGSALARWSAGPED